MGEQFNLTGLAVVALGALVCGIAMARLKQPAIVGYILAGVILGPSGFGLVGNREAISVLAELGVILLLFLVAMELSLRGFMKVWRIAIAASLLQIAISVGVMLALSEAFGWPLELAVLLGFVVALSSTAVVVKMLEQLNILRTPAGQLVIGILIAQDLAVVPMILTLKALAAPSLASLDILKIIASVALLGTLTVYLSRRKRITLPFGRIIAGQADLRPLAGLTLCFAAAALSGLAGLSAAYGAFIAGLIIGNSNARAMMIRSTRPVQSVLIMVFFLSIGLLIDLAFIWQNIGTVLFLLLLVTVFKTALNIGLLHLLREPWPHAFVASVMLAQVGEFSFVLGQTAAAGGLIDQTAVRLIVSITALSLLVSPVWMIAGRRLMRIILLSVTSFDETLELLAGDDIRRLRTAGRAAGGIWRSMFRIGRRTKRRKPANDPAPEPHSEPPARNAGKVAKGAQKSARRKQV